jgi:hypothetical protein
VTATFGDLARLTSHHLDEAVTIPAMTITAGTAATAAHELHRLVNVLSRYLKRAAPYDEVEATTDPDLPGWRRAIGPARQALELASGGLLAESQHEAVRPGAAQPDPVIAELTAATSCMSAGLDLLNSHFAADHEGIWNDMSPWSPVVRSYAVTQALVEQVMRWLGKLALLPDSLSIACDIAGISTAREPFDTGRYWLLTAVSALSGALRTSPVKAEDTDLLMAIPPNLVPDRSPPRPVESVRELTEGIHVSATRLRAVASRTAGHAAWSPAATTDSWKWTATATAIVFSLSQHMLITLAEHASRWPACEGTSSLLHTAAGLAAESCTRWRQVARAWGDLRTETHGLTAPEIQDTSDLLLRVGRLAFNDPDWTPSRSRETAQLPNQARQVPDGAQAAEIAGALHQAADALGELAAATMRQTRTASNAGRLLVPTRTLPARYNVPYAYWHAPPRPAEALLREYQDAVHRSEETAVAAGAAAVSLGAQQSTLSPRVAAIAVTRDPSTSTSGARLREGTRTIRAGTSSGRAETGTGPRGPTERALRRLGFGEDDILMLRAKAIDNAGRNLINDARIESPQESRGYVRKRGPAAMAAENFPGSGSGLHETAHPTAAKKSLPQPRRSPAL